MEIVILGCGSSIGVPVIGCECDVCISSSQFNMRMRSSVLIAGDNANVLIDAGFDIRHQLIKNGIKNIDALVITHDHADHVSGIDDLRVFPLLHNKRVDLYITEQAYLPLEARYHYLFSKSFLIPSIVDFYTKILVEDIEIQLFKQHHVRGVMDSLGIRIKNFVYANDVIDFPDESRQYLMGVDVMVLDCFGYKTTASHAGLDVVLKWYEEFRPQQIYLTNMSHDIDYYEIQKILPPNIRPAYDSMKISI